MCRMALSQRRHIGGPRKNRGRGRLGKLCGLRGSKVVSELGGDREGKRHTFERAP